MRPPPRGPARRWARRGAILAAVLLLADCTVLGDLRLATGFAAFGSPGAGDTDLDVPVSLGPATLGLARLFVRGSRGVSAVLGDLSAVRLYVYDIDGDAARVRERIEAARGRLVEQGWQPLLGVRDAGKEVVALAKLEPDGTISGAALAVQDEDNLVLVNLIGHLRPASVGVLIAELCGRVGAHPSWLDRHLHGMGASSSGVCGPRHAS